jgi:CDP-glucose 4,6-dehydratase
MIDTQSAGKKLRILVSGATGFIGSWLTERLVNDGEQVTILVRPNSKRMRALESFKDKVDIAYGDIRDQNLLERIVRGKDLVFHLAAVTQVATSMRNPVETFSVNFQGTLALLEALRKSDEGQALVFASTDKVYGDPQSLPIAETHPLIGKSPYDASKIAAERAAYAYWKTYGLPLSISRSSNVYGGRDFNFMRAVPDFATSLILRKKVTIRGSGKNVRDYMYVDDAVQGFIKIMHNIDHVRGEVFNFGTGKPTRVAEIAANLSRLFGKTDYETMGQITPGEIDAQYLDCSKARSELGWKPEVELNVGLPLTVRWYSANKEVWINFRQQQAAP